MDEFADYLAELEQRANAEFAAERAIEVAERSKTAYAEVDLLGRLLASTGRALQVTIPHEGTLRGVLVAAGGGWFTLADEAGRVLVITHHVIRITGLAPTAVAPPARPVTAKLSVRSALRAVASEGVQVRMVTSDAAVFTGDLGRVGADFVEISVEGEIVVVPLAHLVTARPRA